MKRYRVRGSSQTYADKGPDLLRPANTTVQRLGSVMGTAGSRWYTRRNPPGDREDWSNWSGPVLRREALARASGFLNSPPGGKFQVGRVSQGKPRMKAEIFIINVREVPLPGTKDGAEMVADLTREQYPNLNVGGYNCREYNGVPGSGWSDHAWGDAVDLSGPNNDNLTDWCVRMGRAGCMAGAQQFIGSINGVVYSFVSPEYRANRGGPSSHRTHVHCSYKQHFGADPNCR